MIAQKQRGHFGHWGILDQQGGSLTRNATEAHALGVHLHGARRAFQYRLVQTPEQLQDGIRHAHRMGSDFWIGYKHPERRAYYVQRFAVRPDGYNLVPGLPKVVRMNGTRGTELRPDWDEMGHVGFGAMAGTILGSTFRQWPTTAWELVENYSTPAHFYYPVMGKAEVMEELTAREHLTERERDFIEAAKMMDLGSEECEPCAKAKRTIGRRGSPHRHSSKMWRCLDEVIAGGADEGKAHRICYNALPNEKSMTFEQENALIRRQAIFIEPQHEFIKAQWTNLDGQERCLLCGQAHDKEEIRPANSDQLQVALAAKRRGYFGPHARRGLRGGSVPRTQAGTARTQAGTALPPKPAHSLTAVPGGAAYQPPGIDAAYQREFGHQPGPKLHPNELHAYFQKEFPSVKVAWSESGPTHRTVEATLSTPNPQWHAALLHQARIWNVQGRISGYGQSDRGLHLTLPNPNYRAGAREEQLRQESEARIRRARDEGITALLRR